MLTVLSSDAKAPRKRTKKVAAEGADNEVAAEGAEGVTAAPKTKAPKKKAPVTRIDDESGEAVEKPAKAPRAPRAPREPPTGEPSATLVFVRLSAVCRSVEQYADLLRP